MELTVFTKFKTESYRRFWKQYPALYYGLAFALGCAAAFSNTPIVWVIPGMLLFMRSWNEVILGLTVAIAAFSYSSTFYSLPLLPQHGIEGSAVFNIDTISDHESMYGSAWKLKGWLYHFENHRIKNAPFHMTLSKKGLKERPEGSVIYKVDKAKLKQNKDGSYRLSVDKEANWYAVSVPWRLVEWRYHAKRAVSDYIHEHIENVRSAHLLVGLSTGEFHDRQTQLSLGRFGLQHILAISGFHFAILVGILSLALGAVTNGRLGPVLLFSICTLYFLFLGYGPSITRAYLATSTFLLGQILHRPSRALNSLGIALLAILTYDPLSCTSIAFQLSFLATAAILVLVGPADIFLQKLWPKRRLSSIAAMPLLHQHGYLILALFRQALALCLAVHIVITPLCLYYFQQFPLMALLYNIFFPFLISISLLLLLLGIVTQIPFFHIINSSYTAAVLNMTYNIPLSWDIWIRTEQPSQWLVIALITGVLMYGIKLQQSETSDLDLKWRVV